VLFFSIAYNVVLPIFLLMAPGFIIQRRLGFVIPSLTRLNFWIFVPAFLFVRFT
jgi:predicted permease